ncbi:MAG: DUF6788 family protein [Pyrinomonadaceae bacterium]
MHRMKIKMEKMLPKMAEEIQNGGVYEQKVRCGRPNCRCASGDLHRGFFYFIRRVDGRQRKTYIRKADVDRLISLAWRARKDRKEKVLAERTCRKLLTEFGGRLREFQSLIANAQEEGGHE